MKQSSHLDTVRHIATPEGCEISLRLAGPVVRAGAWFIDFFIRVIVWIILVNLLAYLGGFGEGLMLISLFLLEWAYPILFEVFWRGRTPGKNILGIAVMNDDGTPVGWSASFVRNTLRVIDGAPILLYAAGFVTIMLNRDGKRLGDLAAGTVVAYVEKRRHSAQAQGQEGAEPPPFPLTVDEQRALIEFRNRERGLTTERAEELASAAEPLTRGLPPKDARTHLMRIANYLLGQR